ncbi:aldo/keto reductase [bacterium]|nr:aldo/keto reductase [bacterium]
MPTVGLGLWKIESDQVESVVVEAIRLGYRHLDSACDYGNETGVGRGIGRAIDAGLCTRDDLWVTSKLWNTYHRREHVPLACERTLRDLGLDELDLYLIHFPIALAFIDFEKRYPPGWFHDPIRPDEGMRSAKVPLAETWQAMEDLVRRGLVRHIGICNMNCSLIRDLLSYASIRPEVLQIERHPYLVQEKLLRYCHTEGIMVTGFSPLGAQSYYTLGMADPQESLLLHPLVEQIARAHRKTTAQVLLRWGVQGGTCVVPKSSQPARLVENIAIFDFELSMDEMSSLDQLDRGRRFNDPGVFAEKAFHTFVPIYE